MDLFKSLGTNFDISEELLENVEKYVCRLYRQLSVDSVNEARFCLFSIGKYKEDTMPCTRDMYHVPCTLCNIHCVQYIKLQFGKVHFCRRYQLHR